MAYERLTEFYSMSPNRGYLGCLSLRVILQMARSIPHIFAGMDITLFTGSLQQEMRHLFFDAHDRYYFDHRSIPCARVSSSSHVSSLLRNEGLSKIPMMKQSRTWTRDGRELKGKWLTCPPSRSLETDMIVDVSKVGEPS